MIAYGLLLAHLGLAMSPRLALCLCCLLLGAGAAGGAPAAMSSKAAGAAGGSAPGAPAAMSVGAAGAPAAQANPDLAFKDQLAVNYVLVPVVVRTRTGYASDLGRKDFRLLVDGRPVPIESFDQRTEAPTSLVFLQDLSGSMNDKIDESQQAVRYFLDRALPGDEFALATFAGGRGNVEVPFTSDTGALRDAVERWQGYGTTALHDAVAWIPEISAAGHNSRRFAIVVTDGVDNASQIPPEQAREIVRAAQVPVYVLGLGAGSPYELTPEGRKVYRYADVLNLLALTTGGRYYGIQRREDMAKALAAVANDLRHQYVLGFSTAEGASSYRKLAVEVRGRDRFTVVFRRGYKGPPPAGIARGG
jgi:Ca-activated chloride channel family protein